MMIRSEKGEKTSQKAEKTFPRRDATRPQHHPPPTRSTSPPPAQSHTPSPPSPYLPPPPPHGTLGCRRAPRRPLHTLTLTPTPTHRDCDPSLERFSSPPSSSKPSASSPNATRRARNASRKSRTTRRVSPNSTRQDGAARGRWSMREDGGGSRAALVCLVKARETRRIA